MLSDTEIFSGISWTMCMDCSSLIFLPNTENSKGMYLKHTNDLGLGGKANVLDN